MWYHTLKEERVEAVLWPGSGSPTYIQSDVSTLLWISSVREQDGVHLSRFETWIECFVSLKVVIEWKNELQLNFKIKLNSPTPNFVNVLSSNFFNQYAYQHSCQSCTSAITMYSSTMNLKLSLRIPTNVFLEEKRNTHSHFQIFKEFISYSCAMI